MFGPKSWYLKYSRLEAGRSAKPCGILSDTLLEHVDDVAGLSARQSVLQRPEIGDAAKKCLWQFRS